MCSGPSLIIDTYLIDTYLRLALAQEIAGRRSDAEATLNRYLDWLIAANATADIPSVRSFQARPALMRGRSLQRCAGCARAASGVQEGRRIDSRFRS
jgi:hypothetical protein